MISLNTLRRKYKIPQNSICIGIVARLTVSSRPDGQEGKSITMNFGEKAEVVSHGMPNGTIILVE